ncbi:MAG: methylenetetrahydrofolate reductase [Alphaproteobacteria bacterium]|nr:methylenetetrahydrofolate reductase [Alphaproteobacteria bacterium]
MRSSMWKAAELPSVSLDGSDQRKRIVELLSTASLELSTADHGAIDTSRAFLPPRSEVYINFVPGDSYDDVISKTAQLSRAGFRPVPHIAVRHLTGFTQLHDVLARARDAGVKRALLIAGDLDRPVGPFHSSLEVIETGLLAKHDIQTVGIAGYPEGHPKIGAAALDAALDAKLRRLHRDGIAPYIVTQFCFDAAPILGWLVRIRAAGIDAPVRIGLAGPASIATLAKFAVRCGIGNSILALVGGQTSVARLLVESGPEMVISALAASDLAGLGVEGLHLFTFGGLVRTGKWLRAAAEGGFALAANGGFRVKGGTP